MKLSKVQRALLREICRIGFMPDNLYAGFERRSLATLEKRGLVHNDTVIVTVTDEGRAVDKEYP